jgi:heavy metal translocating P-type ATPase
MSTLSKTARGAPPGRRISPSAAAPGDTKKPGLYWVNETVIATVTAAGIVVHLLLRYAISTPRQVFLAPLVVTLVFGGVPLVFDLTKKLFRAQFGSDLLAGISIVTAVLLGEYLVGAIVVLMLSGGTALEEFATRRASSVLDALAKRMPQTAHRKSGESVTDVTLSDVAVGDLLVVFPHEICPVDGVVVGGQGRMDESYLTGEPFEIAKTPGSEVLSGAINGETALTLRAEKLPVDSRYARIMRVMQESQQQRPRLRRLGDMLGAWYTPAAVGLALAGWAASGDSRRFLATLVVATPCPLLLAIPVAIIGAISLAARRGIIIKDPAVLEQIDACRTLIFDKTGTLTYGKPALTDILCAAPFQKDEVLRLAAGLERYSKHPLAGAVLDAATRAKLALEPATQMSEHPGEGLRGIVAGRELLITGRNKISRQEVLLPPVAPGLECLVFIDGVYAAAFRFHDAPRKDSELFVGHLGPRHAIKKVMLVSGDRDAEVRYLAKIVGITEVDSGKSPEDKVAIVRAEASREKTLFVGDGINDAPAMQAATVGVAFGTSNDITAEAAGAVILETSLGKIDELLHIGRRMRSIALQSAVGGMALSIIGMLLAVAGYLPPVGGAIAQEIIDLAAVLNAARVALPPASLTDF